MDQRRKITFLLEFQSLVISEYFIFKKSNNAIITAGLVSDVENLISTLFSDKDLSPSHIRARQLYMILRDTMIGLDTGKAPTLNKIPWDLATDKYDLNPQKYLDSYYLAHLYFGSSSKDLASSKLLINSFLKKVLVEISRFTGVMVRDSGLKEALELAKYDYKAEILQNKALQQDRKGKTPEQILAEFQFELDQIGPRDIFCRTPVGSSK